jgi:hypothetical protein
MATTPEGKVKKAIRAALDNYGPSVWYFAPVQNGMGKPALDFEGAHRGRAFSIEAKAPGKVPTDRQNQTILAKRAAGYKVFVIDSEQEIAPLRAWLNGLVE